MQLDSVQEPATQDRRVLRSRSSLLAAAVRLVSERGTTAIPITELADAANVSRQLVYLQFGERDSLLVQAAVDLVRRELIPHIEDGSKGERARALATARHFVAYRSFYRAMLTGSCAFAMTRTLDRSFSSLTKQAVRELFGKQRADTVEDLATFVASGTGAIINDWLIDGDDPLDPEEVADRLARLATVFAGRRRVRTGRGRRR